MDYYDVMIVSPQEYSRAIFDDSHIPVETLAGQIRAEDQSHADAIVGNGILTYKYPHSAHAVLAEGQAHDDTWQVDELLARVDTILAMEAANV